MTRQLRRPSLRQSEDLLEPEPGHTMLLYLSLQFQEHLLMVVGTLDGRKSSSQCSRLYGSYVPIRSEACHATTDNLLPT